MKHFAILLLALASAPTFAREPDSWLHAPTTNINAAEIVSSIPSDRVFEIPASLLDTALVQLRTSSIVPLQDYQVDSLSRGHFSCPSSTHPYLVRAVYENGGTGGYNLQQVDSALWVSHSSLGASSGKHHSGLLVCLALQPSQVFVTTSGAM